jgi:hypothetical protein
VLNQQNKRKQKLEFICNPWTLEKVNVKMDLKPSHMGSTNVGLLDWSNHNINLVIRENLVLNKGMIYLLLTTSYTILLNYWIFD